MAWGMSNRPLGLGISLLKINSETCQGEKSGYWLAMETIFAGKF